MAGSNVHFSADDLRIVIGLCETDHKLTDLLGPRSPLPDMIQHRYRVSTVASKANILLMEIEAQRQAAMRLTPAAAERDPEATPDNGAVAEKGPRA